MRRGWAVLLLQAAVVCGQELPAPDADLRTMLRKHVMRRAGELLARSDEARRAGGAGYRERVRAALGEVLGAKPAGPLHVRAVSRHERGTYRIENVLYESVKGWDVNATLFLPDAARFPPPWKAIVIPVGHSGKQFASYQIPAQVFARSGYVALLFDPPGQSGEKREGNDHFRDGVRCYLTGSTSQRYFVMDALRSIDYLATRADIDMERGVGITGVSGGGFTALYATLLDERIAAAGPSCFAAPEMEHPVRDLYPPCPETLAFDLYGKGLDAVSLLAAACPTPMLMMAGAQDEVFKAEWMRGMAAEVEGVYDKARQGERFRFFLDSGGHAYSVAQALEFVKWMDRWVGRTAGQRPVMTADTQFEMAPAELLQGGPRREENLFTLVRAEARELAGARRKADPRRAAMETARMREGVLPAVTAAKRSKPFLVWSDTAEELLLRVDRDVELPATLLRAANEQKAGAVLYFDDRGRWTELASGGTLGRISGFLAREGVHPAVLTVDLRGWGDTRPAPAPYEAAGWAAPERWLAYVSAAAGDPVLAMRIRDGVAALGWLRAQRGVDGGRVVVGGHGMGGVVALYVAAIDGRVSGVFAERAPASFATLAESPRVDWPHDAFLPGALARADLPELMAGLRMPLLVLNPLDATRTAVNAEAARKLYGEAVTVWTNEAEGATRERLCRWVAERWQ